MVIALVLLLGQNPVPGPVRLTNIDQAILGILAGFVIGLVASLLGVAGVELLIPTLMLLFGADISWQGVSLWQSVCLPC